MINVRINWGRRQCDVRSMGTLSLSRRPGSGGDERSSKPRQHLLLPAQLPPIHWVCVRPPSRDEIPLKLGDELTHSGSFHWKYKNGSPETCKMRYTEHHKDVRSTRFSISCRPTRHIMYYCQFFYIVNDKIFISISRIIQTSEIQSVWLAWTIRCTMRVNAVK